MGSTEKIIYLIDDDNIYQYAIKRKILKRKLSVKIATFKNGREAINQLIKAMETGEPLPYMILLDLNMPIMDGWDFLEQFIRLQTIIKKKIQVYVVSSSIQTSDIDRARSVYGVTDYIVKPMEDKQLDDILLSA